MKIEKKISSLIISLILAIIVFIGLTVVAGKVIAPYGKATVYVATQDLNKGTLITKENVNNYFTKETVQGNLKVSNAVENENSLVNHIATENINKGAVVANNYFIDKDNILNKIENKAEVSFTTNDVSTVLGGIIRVGDIVDLSVVKDKTSESLVKDAYVTKVFAQDNTELKRNDKKPSMTINVIIPQNLVKAFNTAVSEGKIRVSMNK